MAFAPAASNTSGGNVLMITGSLMGHLVYGGLVGGLTAVGNEVERLARA